MRVEDNMFHRQLRVQGKLIRHFLKPMRENEFRKIDKFLRNNLDKIKIKGLRRKVLWITRKKDGTKMRICIFRPLNPKKNIPGVLWLHGGGYAMGVPEASIPNYKILLEESDCVIVAPDYTLSIEKPYPAALLDCYEALLWMKENAKKLGIRTDQLMVGGESAGGGLTAALTMYARDKGEVNIAFQMPIYPMIDDRMTTESARDNNAPVWNSISNEEGWRLYLGHLYESEEVPYYAAPSRATDYTGLPPTATFVGDIEPFCDETVEYIKNLQKAGIPTEFRLYKGCYHGFDMLNSRTDIAKRARAFFADSFHYAVEHYFAEQNE